jgi:hypothetical protein
LKPDGDVLSERSGDFQTADVVLDAPAFIPAKSKARMALSASYRYPSGGRDRDRTGDPLLAKQVLSQLSYTPTAEALPDFKAFAAVRKLRESHPCPLLCHNCVKTPIANVLLERHLIGSAIDFGRCFSSHLQLHLRILLERSRVPLAEHLHDPLIRYTAGTKPCRVS